MEPKHILESLLFSAQRPMSARELREVLANAADEENAEEAAKSLKKVKDDDLVVALEELARDYDLPQLHGFSVVCPIVALWRLSALWFIFGS